jgi:hypothetical protein
LFHCLIIELFGFTPIRKNFSTPFEITFINLSDDLGPPGGDIFKFWHGGVSETGVFAETASRANFKRIQCRLIQF